MTEQCSSCGGFCKKSGCERADYAPPEKQRHLEGFWCKDLTCKKCYSADFRFKHAIQPQRTLVWLTDEEIEAEFGYIDELLRDICYRTQAMLKEKNQ